MRQFTRRELLIAGASFLAIGTFSLSKFKNLGKKNNPQVKNPSLLEGEIEKEFLKKHVETLASPEYQGRRSGTSGEATTVLYLSQELKKMGLKPAGEQGTYFQTFSLPQTTLKIQEKRLGFSLVAGNSPNLMADNVLALLPGKSKSQEYVVLSAHHDHLGFWENNLYRGAVDNASGVAALLEIARVLQGKADQLSSSILFAFWGGEEMGLLGSDYFVQNPTIPLNKIRYNINLDSIGSGETKEFISWGSSLKEISGSLERKLVQEKIILDQQWDTKHASDHKSFLKGNIPALTILAKDWLTDNHTPLDTPEKVNLEKVFELAQALAHSLID